MTSAQSFENLKTYFNLAKEKNYKIQRDSDFHTI